MVSRRAILMLITLAACDDTCGGDDRPMITSKDAWDATEEAGATERDGLAKSLPIPGTVDDDTVLTVFIHRRSTKRDNRQLKPPSRILVFKARGGELVKNEPCKPSDFGVGDDPDDWAPLGLPADLEGGEHIRLWDEMSALTPDVLEAFDKRDSAQIKKVRRWLEIYDRIQHKPLTPYDARVGEAFFSWAKHLK